MKQFFLSLALLAGALLLIGILIAVIAAWPTIVLLSNMFVWVLFVAVSVAALGGALWLMAFGAKPVLELLLTALERRQTMRHAERRLMLEEHLALTRITPDERGNYSAVLGDNPYTRIAPGNPPYPLQIASPRPVGKTTIDEQAPLQGIQAQIAAPSQQVLLGQLQENTLMVSPGVRASTGEIVTVSITDVPHFKIIGSTGFGKSCLAAALIDQACQLNTPDVFQIALLDLEHKTSRLFENRANVAEIPVGKRIVPLVATTPDEVAEHLGYLKRELERRTRLSEYDLAREPVLLIYVEEMLALQYELVDEKTLARFFADLTILAVRGRKYGMFLMAVMQTDYSSSDMKTTQKMFRFRCAAGIDITTARAAGFINTELVKHNFINAQPGQFVVEYPAFSDVVLAPRYDVKALLRASERDSEGIQEPTERETPPHLNAVRTVSQPSLNDTANHPEPAAELASDIVEQVRYYRRLNWSKNAIVEKIWNVRKGGSQRYKDACAAYDQIVSTLAKEAEA